MTDKERIELRKHLALVALAAQIYSRRTQRIRRVYYWRQRREERKLNGSLSVIFIV